MSDFDNKDRKENRKQKFLNKKKRPFDLSEEQRFLSKSKKAFKQKRQHMKDEEPWDDWKDNY
jgi:hypothetical protein